MLPFIDYQREKKIPRPRVDVQQFDQRTTDAQQFILSLKEETAINRLNTLHAIAAAGSGHPGGSFSAAEIVTTLFAAFLTHDPANPRGEQRDRFILSKGHGVPIVYAALASRGFFSVDRLATLRRLGGLPGHASPTTPGIDAPTGSLGQGLSYAQGIAEALALKDIDANVYTILGDGELQEGQIWEAARSIGNRSRGSIIALLDNNGVQQTGPVESISSLASIRDKFLAFGWHVIGQDARWGAPRDDGHDHIFLINALAEAQQTTRPTLIICNTVKGKGVSFMENKAQWHGKAPKGEEYQLAAKELTAQRDSAVAAYEELR